MGSGDGPGADGGRWEVLKSGNGRRLVLLEHFRECCNPAVSTKCGLAGWKGHAASCLGEFAKPVMLKSAVQQALHGFVLRRQKQSLGASMWTSIGLCAVFR
jgi:hypothetical protein